MLLVAGAIVLLVSILIGQKLGDRVLLQTERRSPLAGGAITPVPQTEPTAEAALRNWKRLQVVSVATDPGFPDPRVTRPPTPTPAPQAAAPPRPRVTPIPEPVDTPTPPPASTYTSPPLPLPLATHEPGETETEPPTLSPQERANVAPSVNATATPHF